MLTAQLTTDISAAKKTTHTIKRTFLTLGWTNCSRYKNPPFCCQEAQCKPVVTWLICATLTALALVFDIDYGSNSLR